MNVLPDHDEFMDADMRRLWHRMGPLPGGLRLYGGTAMALYRNHRASTDFDFATPEKVIDIEFVAMLPWLLDTEAKIMGGRGMVDADIEGEERTIKLTFMECGTFVPMPHHAPISAANGVAVAHPVDLVASKIEACLTRGDIKDYRDMAEAADAWPEWCREAAYRMPSRAPQAVGRVLAALPTGIAERLPQEPAVALRKFARSLALDKELNT